MQPSDPSQPQDQPQNSEGQSWQSPPPAGPAPASPQTTYQQPYQQQSSPYGPGATAYGQQPGGQSQSNALPIIGLVLSFLFAPVGLIVSIIALKKHKDGAGKVMSIIGIVVSALGIIFVGLGILMALMATPALQKSAKGVKERTDLANLQSHLEASYSENNGATYPSLAQLNDESWRSARMSGLNVVEMSPNSSVLQLVSGEPTENSYAYNPLPANCDASPANPCKSYTLSAKLPIGKVYQVNSLSD